MRIVLKLRIIYSQFIVSCMTICKYSSCIGGAEQKLCKQVWDIRTKRAVKIVEL